ncbi:MAG: hypothetical protein ACI9NN_000382 [Bacteroidia bacterium]|jgi:hypothetical protein
MNKQKSTYGNSSRSPCLSGNTTFTANASVVNFSFPDEAKLVWINSFSVAERIVNFNQPTQASAGAA